MSPLSRSLAAAFISGSPPRPSSLVSVSQSCSNVYPVPLRSSSLMTTCEAVMKIRIAHSPDSDDAFMFYGLASGKVPSNGFELEHVLSDIETLNRAAFQGLYEITAVSFHAYAHLADRYLLLPHGASMGDRYGPIVVARTEATSLDGLTVAVPGTLTTAFLTLRLFDPSVEWVVMPFDTI